MLESIISLYAPHACIGCNTEGALLCPNCLQDLPQAAGRCYRCRALSKDGLTCQACHRASKLYAVRAVTYYDGVAKDLVGKLKFSGGRAGASVIAEAILRTTPLPPGGSIIPVPTASSRVRLRGYDQAILIAKALAQASGADYLPCLTRQGQHRQVGANRTERLQNMRDSFWVRDEHLVADRHVVLIDDVMTTGATLESAAAVLKAEGAKRVEAVVFARA